MANEAEYSKSSEQEYKEGLRETDEERAEKDTGREMIVEGNDLDGYVGVDPAYQNYANETEKPMVGDGVDAEIAEEFRAGTEVTEKSDKEDSDSGAKPDEVSAPKTATATKPPVKAASSAKQN